MNSIEPALPITSKCGDCRKETAYPIRCGVCGNVVCADCWSEWHAHPSIPCNVTYTTATNASKPDRRA